MLDGVDMSRTLFVSRHDNRQITCLIPAISGQGSASKHQSESNTAGNNLGQATGFCRRCLKVRSQIECMAKVHAVECSLLSNQAGT